MQPRVLMEQVIAEVFASSSRAGSPLGLVVAGLDGLGAINESFGDEAGDQVLRATTERLAKALRKRDIFGRWSGDRFVALLPETDTRGATAVSERLRRLAEASAHTVAPGRTLAVTLSVGFATLGSQAFGSGADFLAAAEQAMAGAKAAGRNCVVSWTVLASKLARPAE